MLPAPLILTPAQRAAIDQYQAAVAHVLEQTPERNNHWSQRTLVSVSKLLMALAGREGGDLAGEAKGAAYMAALDDVPYWATEEAARLWYRGECGDQHNYNWPPAPAILRTIARRSEYAVRSRSAELQQLLGAEIERVIGVSTAR